MFRKLKSVVVFSKIIVPFVLTRPFGSIIIFSWRVQIWSYTTYIIGCRFSLVLTEREKWHVFYTFFLVLCPHVTACTNPVLIYIAIVHIQRLPVLLVSLVQRLDNGIQRIHHYPVDTSWQNKPRYPLDSAIHLSNNPTSKPRKLFVPEKPQQNLEPYDYRAVLSTRSFRRIHFSVFR